MNDELQHAGIKGMKWGIRRYQNKDGSLTPAGRKKYGHDDHRNAHDRKRIEDMSNAELRDRNNRLQMERQYRELTKKTGIGKQAVSAFIGTAGTIAGVMGAYATYKKVGGMALDKIGGYIVKGINLGGPLTK